MAVDKDAGSIRRMFADISPRYDFLNHFLSLNLDRSWRRRVARELALEKGARVLDVCTGTADLALELARGISPALGGRVVGSDFTPEMLRLGAVKRARRAGGSEPCGVELCQADALRLPFADGTFDAVTVAFGIRNVSDLDAGLREMRRVLRPGGKAAVLEFSTPRSRWLRGAFLWYFHRVLPRLGGWVSGSQAGRRAYSYLPRSVSEFLSPEELSRRLEGAGFTRARCVPLACGVAAIHVAERPARILTAVSARGGAEP
jgi:demethylmenaquinone methyltransferase/2-methoxy-6-polyprenyl-1,4-benzoquinol methylase